MKKEQFKEELKLALKDPKAYFNIHKSKNPLTGKNETLYNSNKLNNFFQSFSTHYLDSDIADLTSKFPTVEFKQLQEHDKYAVGKYENKTKEINLNIDLFLMGTSSSIGGLSSTVLTGFLATLCHEHQHFKQNLYVELKQAGKHEEAKKLEPMLGISPNSAYGVSVEEIEQTIKKPLTGQDIIAHDLFMAHTIPDKHKKMKSGNILVNEIGQKIGKRSPLEVAYYFHDPHEVDARERSVEIFENKFDEISGGDPLINKHKTRTAKMLKSFNKKALKIQPKRVIELFEEEKGKIDAEQLLKFAGKIEKSLGKEKVDISSIHDTGSFHFEHKPSMTEVERQSFVLVLKERLSTLPENEADKLLETLKTSGNAYASQVAGDLTSTPQISKPSALQIAEERESLKPSTKEPTQQKTVTQNREKTNEQFEEQQMHE